MGFFPRSTITFALGLALPLVAAAADLRVAVSGGPAAPAVLYVALFDSAEAMAANEPLASQKLPMHDGVAQLVFAGLAPGRYAVKTFTDENGNGRLDTNLVGLPTERYGFSNDAVGRMGPPDFEAAAVTVDTDRSIGLRQR
jgi:uncharacterized protein (DUF2141 family)